MGGLVGWWVVGLVGAPTPPSPGGGGIRTSLGPADGGKICKTAGLSKEAWHRLTAVMEAQEAQLAARISLRCHGM